MREVGKVTEVNGAQAVVRVMRSSACAKCHMCSFNEGEKHIDLTLDNSVNARVGDSVELEMSGGYVLGSALIAYGIPLVLAAVGLAVGLCFKNELVQLLLCVAALAVGFAAVGIFDKKIKRKARFAPRILRVVDAS
ncbi:MAG: SoxR reducing system RseC family protein [Clostridia bacterium]|nr:SoxR reducing system RseC family protein [Clostridia bacterium]